MSEENLQDEEVLGTNDQFNKEKALEHSRSLVSDMLLIDGQTEKPLFLAVPPQDGSQEDGMAGGKIFICLEEPDSEFCVVHTVFSSKMKTEELFNPQIQEVSDIVGLDGQPLSSNDEPSGIVGLDGETLS